MIISVISNNIIITQSLHFTFTEDPFVLITWLILCSVVLHSGTANISSKLLKHFLNFQAECEEEEPERKHDSPNQSEDNKKNNKNKRNKNNDNTGNSTKMEEESDHDISKSTQSQPQNAP